MSAQWDRLHVLDLDERRALLLDPQTPGWIVVARTDADLVRCCRSGVRPGPTAAARLQALAAALQRPPLPAAAAAGGTARGPDLYIELTNACNLCCRHCYNHSGDPARAGRQLPPQAVIALLQEARRRGAAAVTFSGGEPLLYRGLADLIAAARAVGLAVTVVTNATLITPATAAWLVRSGAALDVSLEGAGAAVHDRLRGSGSFAAALGGLANLAAAGYDRPLSISMVLNRHNQHELPAMAELAQAHGATRLQLIFVAAQGRAAAAWDDLHLSRADLARLCCAIFDLRQELTGKLEIENEVVSTAVLTLLLGGRATGYACSVCRQLRVDAAGNLHPCAFFSSAPYQLGNVLQAGSLQAALQESAPVSAEIAAAQHHRAARVSRVAACPWRGYCGGGCMAAAAGREGTVWGVGDLCCDVAETLYLHILRRMPLTEVSPGAQDR